MAKENKTRFAVLGLLAWRGPLSGYQVKQTYEMSADFFWSVSYGQVYPTLKQLEAEGLVASSTERDEGRPERRVYELTDRGRDSLDAWLEAPTDPLEFRAEVLLKMLHGFREPPGVMISHVQELKTQLEGDGDRREQTVAHLRPGWEEAGLSDAVPYWMLIGRFGELMNGAIRQWCEEALPVLERLKLDEENGGGIDLECE